VPETKSTITCTELVNNVQNSVPNVTVSINLLLVLSVIVTQKEFLTINTVKPVNKDTLKKMMKKEDVLKSEKLKKLNVMKTNLLKITDVMTVTNLVKLVLDQDTSIV